MTRIAYNSQAQFYSKFTAALQKQQRSTMLSGKLPSLGRQPLRIVRLHLNTYILSLLMEIRSLLEPQLATSV